MLIKANAPVDCPVSEDQSTPLHKACAGTKEGHIEAVKLLIDAGADVHALNKWRETPLLTAANHGQTTAVEYLLEAGADPCRCTDTGWSPLSIAAYKGHDDVVRLLLEEGAPTEKQLHEKKVAEYAAAIGALRQKYNEVQQEATLALDQMHNWHISSLQAPTSRIVYNSPMLGILVTKRHSRRYNRTSIGQTTPWTSENLYLGARSARWRRVSTMYLPDFSSLYSSQNRNGLMSVWTTSWVYQSVNMETMGS